MKWKSTDVSEENIASIFRFEKYDKQETSMNNAARRRPCWLLACHIFQT
jgi:hypothetical protein